MWLLDANMDVHLVEVLRQLGVVCDTADRLGWKALVHGELVGKAVAVGFTCLLTRDRRFGESASRALRTYRSFAVVVVVLPQVDSAMHLQQFRAAWSGQPIEPVPGSRIHWPPCRQAN